MNNKYSITLATIGTTLLLSSTIAFAGYTPFDEATTNSSSAIKPTKQEKPDTGSEKERLRKLVKEQEDKIRLRELQKKAAEQQQRIEKLDKTETTTSASTKPKKAPPEEKPTVNPIKEARIKLIKQALAEKPDKESDYLLRGLQKLSNHEDRKQQKKQTGTYGESPIS